MFDLDHVKLSLGKFFTLSCLKGSLLHQLSASTSIFVNKKNTPKSCKLSVVHHFSCGKGSFVVPWSEMFKINK